MLELEKKISHEGTVEVVVKTNEGDFILHKCEDNTIQVGSEYNVGISSYVISMENIEIYNKFLATYRELYNGVDLEDITIASTEFKSYAEASYLTIGIDKATRNIVLTLTQSASSEWRNHSWVTVPDELQPVFERLYNNLNNINEETNQISIIEYIDVVMKDLVRTRQILSGKKQ